MFNDIYNTFEWKHYFWILVYKLFYKYYYHFISILFFIMGIYDISLLDRVLMVQVKQF